MHVGGGLWVVGGGGVWRVVEVCGGWWFVCGGWWFVGGGWCVVKWCLQFCFISTITD